MFYYAIKQSSFATVAKFKVIILLMIINLSYFEFILPVQLFLTIILYLLFLFLSPILFLNLNPIVHLAIFISRWSFYYRHYLPNQDKRKRQQSWRRDISFHASIACRTKTRHIVFLEIPILFCCHRGYYLIGRRNLFICI